MRAIASGRSSLATSGDRRRAGRAQQLPRLPQIVGALHEAERHEIDADADAELQVFDVLGGQRRAPAASRLAR